MLFEVIYTARFLRQYRRLTPALQTEAKEKVTIFKKNPHDPLLKTHKLHGRLKGYWSFSVNYKYRIIFEYDDKSTAALLKIGDHDIYE